MREGGDVVEMKGKESAVVDCQGCIIKGMSIKEWRNARRNESGKRKEGGN